jgi:hypothetical protein
MHLKPNFGKACGGGFVGTVAHTDDAFCDANESRFPKPSDRTLVLGEPRKDV